ncbi:hypothetical protein EUGRSUZ_B00378 [Eucalyptus grandis]|uniref:Uncharacterized protein n=2 Tax=Eucalyptus grandis TaxID=71139 RepID=A0ACC3LLY9_EUCGR|nr:hypothetical protein EUGRSUZ_B00378 [Eucalyptus grandis]
MNRRTSLIYSSRQTLRYIISTKENHGYDTSREEHASDSKLNRKTKRIELEQRITSGENRPIYLCFMSIRRKGKKSNFYGRFYLEVRSQGEK